MNNTVTPDIEHNPTTIEQRVSKLVDPEYHYRHLAYILRKKMKEAETAYQECLKYGLVGDFYTVGNKVVTHFPDTVVLKKTQVSKY